MSTAFSLAQGSCDRSRMSSAFSLAHGSSDHLLMSTAFPLAQGSCDRSQMSSAFSLAHGLRDHLRMPTASSLAQGSRDRSMSFAFPLALAHGFCENSEMALAAQTCVWISTGGVLFRALLPVKLLEPTTRQLVASLLGLAPTPESCKFSHHWVHAVPSPADSRVLATTHHLTSKQRNKLQHAMHGDGVDLFTLSCVNMNTHRNFDLVPFHKASLRCIQETRHTVSSQLTLSRHLRAQRATVAWGHDRPVYYRCRKRGQSVPSHRRPVRVQSLP